MSQRRTRSLRGVYYDLSKSPYEFTTPYGDIFKFPSEKKLEIYTRDIETELGRVKKAFQRFDIEQRVPKEITNLIYKEVYRAFYYRIVG